MSRPEQKVEFNETEADSRIYVVIIDGIEYGIIGDMGYTLSSIQISYITISPSTLEAITRKVRELQRELGSVDRRSRCEEAMRDTNLID